ncbi:hypothetical protein GCM10009555_073990 [Acrocarpospora macrocephala]|uniref:Uncharacterized protein n=1 Tax=Acrocarpospora macrocephala TaxID=150177 RepID=A0A5M3WY37_9ACTN|nr:hypothetical protein Amac_050400 [Acrocarpospora macrocephala]
MKGLQADLCTPFGEVFGVLDGKRMEPRVVLNELGAIELRATSMDANSIFKVGKVADRRITLGNRGGERGMEFLLDRGGCVGVLGEQPGGMRGLGADQRYAWPALGPHDGGEPGGVFTIGFGHASKIGVGSLGDDGEADLLVAGCSPKEFSAQLPVDAHDRSLCAGRIVFKVQDGGSGASDADPKDAVGAA